MDLTALFKSLEATSLATGIRNSLFLFPMLEAVHVIGLALVFGTIVVIDLRALGVASRGRGFAKMATDLLKWTWIGFAIAAVTGALMFTTNAQVYSVNTFFRIKLVLLALAGLNMLVFQFTAGKTIHQWSEAPTAPPIGKVAAILSLCLWVSIIFMGRLIGFTTTGQQAKEAPAATSDIDFDALVSGAAADAPPAAPAAPAK